MKKIIIVLASLFCAFVLVFMACIGDNALIKVKKSDFCANIPEGQYSIICEVTAHFGTTPEAVRVTTKVSNLVMVDQAYTANAADKFLENVQNKVKEFKSLGGTTWSSFSTYVLGQFRLLPPKVQSAINITQDLFEFNPPAVSGRFLSDLDWLRIEGNLADQRILVAPFKK